ncbi:MAG: aromatic amino acid aminotransferase [Pusillimonas sp.]|nr:aromatic amino acid aminotransferase [Pusillimonas sp.]MBC43666.1 aromatic amino acid aminotransferase [Pusillimonas sp.]HCP76345.1 aromatic amino acid aminotransferase [Pusillimonas sp.]|tara:strand:- start:8173 stop:9372 length:1200 start_codon:yes stop_codon:yes gene_type:complete
MTSIFESVELAPRDPILGLNEQYSTDTRSEKVNLGVGVYYDDNGRVPLLKAVREAEKARVEQAAPRAYLPIDGLAPYNKGAQTLLLGENNDLAASGRALTVQTLGGTGALKIGADFLKKIHPNAKVAISNPSWANHKGIFEGAGFQVDQYPYYNPETHGFDFEGMLGALKAMPKGTIVVLHACCHNPTGVDPSAEQWKQIAEAVKEAGLVPFLDIAYQGFGDGLEEDAYVVRLFAGLDISVLISSSFSKSFSLYGERVGALTLLCASKDESARVLSQLKIVVRTNYSNPPTHGGTVVSTVLNTPELYQLWVDELGGMRNRIRDMRTQLVQKLKEHGVTQNFDFVLAQRGMFSYSGLSKEQVEALRADHGVYAVGSGRICVAALNSGNIDHVAQSIAKVL